MQVALGKRKKYVLCTKVNSRTYEGIGASCWFGAKRQQDWRAAERLRTHGAIAADD